MSKLTDKQVELARQFTRLANLNGCGWTAEGWNELAAILQYEQPAPELDDALVKRMCAASDAAQDDCIGSEARAMAAALSVANEARDAQWEKAILDEIHEECAKPLAYCLSVIKGCRERLAAKPKTPEERVTISNHGAIWHVCVDSLARKSFYVPLDAAIYRDGLIARMKREQVQP